MAEPDRCRVLAAAEKSFPDSAQLDRLSASWIAHAGNVAVNASLALILGLGYGRWKSAAISAGVGLAMGEVNLFTQPHGLVDAERRYRSGLFPNEGPRMTWGVMPLFGQNWAGVAIKLCPGERGGALLSPQSVARSRSPSSDL